MTPQPQRKYGRSRNGQPGKADFHASVFQQSPGEKRSSLDVSESPSRGLKLLRPSSSRVKGNRNLVKERVTEEDSELKYSNVTGNSHFKPNVILTDLHTADPEPIMSQLRGNEVPSQLFTSPKSARKRTIQNSSKGRNDIKAKSSRLPHHTPSTSHSLEPYNSNEEDQAWKDLDMAVRKTTDSKTTILGGLIGSHKEDQDVTYGSAIEVGASPGRDTASKTDHTPPSTPVLRSLTTPRSPYSTNSRQLRMSGRSTGKTYGGAERFYLTEKLGSPKTKGQNSRPKDALELELTLANNSDNEVEEKVEDNQLKTAHDLKAIGSRNKYSDELLYICDGLRTSKRQS